VFSEAPEHYDLIYRSFKDYETEAASVAALLRTVAPEARSVLDVACGTGEHARYLHGVHGYDVNGLDIEPGFVEIARAKLPDGRVWLGDMTDFELGVRFDVILCLFSSIGYMCDLQGVERALRCFHRHLAPSGIVMVEPWFEPDSWHAGRVHVQSGESEELRVVRMSHSSVEGHVSRLEFHYLIGTDQGVEHRVEHHEMGLYTRGQMRGCFEKAGFLKVDHDPQGLTGRGLYTARANAAWIPRSLPGENAR
jgi:SAM-dependent methyltransferase